MSILRSAIHDSLPLGVRRSLSKFGVGLAGARRKRHLTMEMMGERIGVAKGTYARIEKGDTTVAMGVYAMALFVLGVGKPLGDLADARRDDHGLLLDQERLTKQVRVRKLPTSL